MIKFRRVNYIRPFESSQGTKQFPKRVRLFHALCLSVMMSIGIFSAGCQTTHSDSSRNNTSQEVLDAVGSVTGALIGKELTEAEKRKMLHDLRKDKEARSAMESISGALDVQQTAIKYCPVDGKRFSSEIVDCPEHKVKLKELVD